MLDRQTQLSIVQSAMASYSGRAVRTENYTMICCPYHDDSTPSGQIFHGLTTRVVGYYKCLGCGARRTWNELAKDQGWQTFKGVKPDDRYAMELPERKEEVAKEEVTFTLSSLPKKKRWRTFPTKFLKDVGCKLGTYEYGRKFVYMPVLVGGRERGYIRAALRKDPTGKYPSYLNKKGTWSKKYGLFPFDYTIEFMESLDSATVVLVEGPRDALRLLYYGIPALAVLGTQTWTAHKARLLELHGVRNVLLMFDGDPAGIAASKLVQPDIRDLMRCRDLELWNMRGSPYREWSKLDEDERKERKSELWDPGNAPERVLRSIRNRYFKEVQC